MSMNDIKINHQRIYDAGKKAEYDAFWDTYQTNGTREDYQYGFNGFWSDETYNPKYPIVCGSLSAYTAEALFAKSSITDTKVPISIIGTRADSICMDCTKLKRIPSLTFENLVRFANSCFRNCRELEELNLYGTVDIDGLDLHWSTFLNKASIVSVINCLSEDTTGLTVTLSQTAVNNAFTEAEWNALESTKGNWTISLV